MNDRRTQLPTRLAWSGALAVCIWLAPAVAHALTCTWNRASAANFNASTTYWSCGQIPISTDDVVFDGTGSGNCNITSSISVASISINSGYGGTVTQSSGVTITTSGNFTQGAGTFTGGNSTIDLGLDFIQTLGIFNSTSGLLKVGDDFSKTLGTFNHSNGRVMLATEGPDDFASGGAAFYDLIINDGLVGYWKFDETSLTNAADGSGYGGTGTFSNSPTQSSASGPPVNFYNPRYLTFDGSTEGVSMPGNARYSFTAGESYTVSAWIKPTSTTVSTWTGVVTISRDASPWYGIWISPSPSAKWFGASPSQAAYGGLIATGWHHVVMMQDGPGNRTYMFVDGVDTSESAYTARAANGGGTIWIGRSSTGEYFSGSIDDVRIYNRKLSNAEIYSLYIGNQPGENVGTLTMAGALNVDHDLTIASGRLEVGTEILTVGGSWWNYGGLFTTGTSGGVIFDGTGTTNYIRSNGQMFQDLDVFGSGTWTVGDRLIQHQDRLIDLTDGELNGGAYTSVLGDINSSGGTFNPGTGTLVLNTNASKNLNTPTYNHLRIEDATETSLAGYWKLDEGRGISARDSSGNSLSGTLNNVVRWADDDLPAIDFDNPSALKLDGGNDYVSIPEAVIATNAAHSVCAWVKLNDVSGFQTVVSQNGSSASGFYLQLRSDTGKYAYNMVSTDTTSGTPIKADAATAPTVGEWDHLCGTYDLSNLRLYVNGTLTDTQPHTTAWSAAGNTIIGRGQWNGAGVDYLDGFIDDVRLYSVPLNQEQVSALAAGGYPNLGGTATYTLTANATVGGTFAIDSGTLATSTFTVTTANSDTSKMAYVNAGNYIVGSAAQTFKGGLTVQDLGTLTMNTTGGIVEIESGTTFNMDGTLNKSTSTVTPTIRARASTGSYTFNVGSTSTATPVLNIDGLLVQDTGTNGMYINAVAGSTTTFTRFDNIAFSSGTGSYLLRIYAPTLYLVANNCSFDGSTSSNVKLAGDGYSTSLNQTRVMFGDATCTGNTPCESFDADDDATADGVGDAGGLADEAVVQWVRNAPTDTAGIIEGFPTAAFDWSTFTYYSTYVAYRNYSGTTDRIYVRNSSGDPKSATYHWDLPASVGDILGTPRWTNIGGTRLLYVGTTSGRVYKLVDNGTSLAMASSPWDTPYWNTGSATITSPLITDATNVYWVGLDSAGARKFFVLTHGKVLTSAALSVAASVTAAMGLHTISNVDYAYVGMLGHFYKIKVSDQTLPVDSLLGTATINGRITILNSIAYAGDNIGKLWGLNASTLATDWSYQDLGNHGSSCPSGGNCTIQNIYVDFSVTPNRVIYGDQDGHIYAVSKSGSSGVNMDGFPIQPVTGEAYVTAPLYRSGIIVAGTSSGSVVVVNRQTTSGGAPTVVQHYKLGSAVSSISFDQSVNSNAGAYVIGTANGQLYYIDPVTDGDAFR
jgi:hypothetical protein